MMLSNDEFTRNADAEMHRHDGVMRDARVGSDAMHSEVIFHHDTMMAYARALVAFWRHEGKKCAIRVHGVQKPPLADIDRIERMRRYIEEDAETLGRIKIRLFPAMSRPYCMDDAQRLALLPAILVAARRIYEQGAGDVDDLPMP